ncbi:cytochrome P450 [Mycena polygramma]|nr:cytochrome P450 [Mycena polygramma]
MHPLFYLLATAVAIVIFRYPSRCIGTSARHELPGPKGYPLIGNLLSVWANRYCMIPFMHKLNKAYGPLSTLTVPGWGRIVVINYAPWLAHVKQNDVTRYSRGNIAVSVFERFPGYFTPVATEGDEWRQARKIVKPIFSAKPFENHLISAMDQILPITVQLLSNVAKAGIAIDWNDLAGRLALSIFCKCSFDMDTRMLRADPACLEEEDIFVKTSSTLSKISSDRLFNPYWRVTEKLDGTSALFSKTINQLWTGINALITERTKLAEVVSINAESMDFLSSLLQSPVSSNSVFVRNIMVTLLFGGRDTTQSCFSYGLYELCRQPVWLSQMRQEAIRVGKNGQLPTFSTLSAYPIHLAVFYETCRLWPGLPKNSRFALEDDILPGDPEHSLPDVKVEKGTYVLWSDQVIMRDPRTWGNDASEFNPARHLSSDGQCMKPAGVAFTSFGAGPRHCPAAHTLPYEWVVLWTQLLPLFSFEAVSTAEMSPGHESLTNSMTSPFMVYVKELNGDGP